MNSNQVYEEIREGNLSYMLLAQQMYSDDNKNLLMSHTHASIQTAEKPEP